MIFDKENYTVEKLTIAGETIEFRAFRGRIYVDKPVNPEYQQMNIFAPEAYYRGESINGYEMKTAPVFVPNMVGGYMPGKLDEPGAFKRGDKEGLNTVFRGLQHGYVVAVPAIRGRVQQNEEGRYTGKAPACIVDYKAAVRFLHYFAEDLPGDMNKIITNGTSAGGALSALMGATGNHPDYIPYLEALGAAKAGDEVFAASCYCPITNLDHGDMAYEWQFAGVNNYRGVNMKMGEDGKVTYVPVEGEMSEQQIQVSAQEAGLFPQYLNSLELKDEQGNPLSLEESGEGSFKEYIKAVILKSAQRALDQGADISDKSWLTVKDGETVQMDWDGYVRDITRMKTAPAFDDLSLKSPENNLFGTETVDCRHFTGYSAENSLVKGETADSHIVKMLNPMYYIEDGNAVTASHWRIRHGECDRDTSLAISAMLTLKLQENGCQVDYFSPWNVPHDGDYDLDELFAWIDGICK